MIRDIIPFRILRSLVLTILSVCTPFFAYGMGVNQSGLGVEELRFHEVGPDSIELVIGELDSFLVRRDGDRRSQGELRSIFVSLGTTEERHSFGTIAPNLWNFTQRNSANDTYLKMRTGDEVQLLPRGVRPERSIFVRGLEGTSVRLSVTARELDCIRKQLCDRENTGVYTLEFPFFLSAEMVSENCTQDTTFRLLVSDDGVVIDGGFRRPEAVDVTITEMENSKPILAVKSAIFCFRTPR
ncbi:MAG: hypothetical protein AAF826_04950 [Pseudomonadota bacterium]